MWSIEEDTGGQHLSAWVQLLFSVCWGGNFPIYVLFILKCCDLCCNLFLCSLIFALLTDPSSGFRISACAPARTVSAFFFFFFTTVMWCWPRPPRKPLLLHLIHISGCTLLYPPCSHLLMRLARCTIKIHFMSRICRFTQQKLWADCREALLSAGTASMTESVEC